MKKTRLSAVLLIFLLLCPGCAWFHAAPATPAALGASADLPGDSWVQTGKILNAPALRQGGKVFIVPFKAGVNVAADDELDQITLMMVKGIAETLLEKGANFEVLGGDRAQEADLVVTGYVTEVGRASKFRRWMPGNPKISLHVEGRMARASSQENVVVFSHGAQAQARGKDHKQLGYDIGKDIGHFILSGQK